MLLGGSFLWASMKKALLFGAYTGPLIFGGQVLYMPQPKPKELELSEAPSLRLK